MPSNIWVGVGLMKPAQVTFWLAPIYERAGIEFVQAGAREIHREGNDADPTPYVTAEFADGRTTEVRYDFLIKATGPALRFDKTPGLGPDAGNSLSVCLPSHAAQAATRLDEEVERMRRGERRTFLVGVGHGTCTCEGAAFEYIVNLEFELRKRGVRDKAQIVWITNEYELEPQGTPSCVRSPTGERRFRCQSHIRRLKEPPPSRQVRLRRTVPGRRRRCFRLGRCQRRLMSPSGHTRRTRQLSSSAIRKPPPGIAATASVRRGPHTACTRHGESHPVLGVS